DSTLMNISARQLTKEDLVLALSVSGETSLVIAAANMAKSRGAAIVSFTNLGSNTLSDMADENIYVTSTNFVKSGLQVLSRVELLIVCEYLFFRYIESYGSEYRPG
ncbi:MAG TPA: SIS domain-containing protein, partial [Candidatus Gemmiger excrementavium]|nr:SIS domain-containing protein [Candidatus Gemmiger excrementavium]